MKRHFYIFIQIFIVSWAITATYLLVTLEKIPFWREEKISFGTNKTGQIVKLEDVISQCYKRVDDRYGESGDGMQYEDLYLRCIIEKINYFADQLIEPDRKQEFKDKLDKFYRQLDELFHVFYCGQWGSSESIFCGSIEILYGRFVSSMVSEILLEVVIANYNSKESETSDEYKEQWYKEHPEWQPGAKESPLVQDQINDNWQ
ncbi:MAG: hypothetical protein H7833_16180 [Magnetococcus sp. DMHC-1]